MGVPRYIFLAAVEMAFRSSDDCRLLRERVTGDRFEDWLGLEKAERTDASVALALVGMEFSDTEYIRTGGAGAILLLDPSDLTECTDLIDPCELMLLLLLDRGIDLFLLTLHESDEAESCDLMLLLLLLRVMLLLPD